MCEFTYQNNRVATGVSARCELVVTASSTVFVRVDDGNLDHLYPHHMQPAQSFFTSCVCTPALPIIHLLDDTSVNADGVSGRIIILIIFH